MSALTHLNRVRSISALLFTLPLLVRVTDIRVFWMNPPVGVIAGYMLPLILFTGISLTALLPLTLNPAQNKMCTGLAIALTAISLIVYVSSLVKFGRFIEVPIRHISVFVIVGAERTPYARTYFYGLSDSEMLALRGWSTSALEKCFTQVSLRRAQLMALTSFAMIFVCLNWVVSSIATQDSRTSVKP